MATKTYDAWKNMKRRCDVPDCKDWKNYGGRGISYDKAWASFAVFYADMGTGAEGLSLERKNNELGYSKNNCSWVTAKEQANNRRTRFDAKPPALYGIRWNKEREEWLVSL